MARTKPTTSKTPSAAPSSSKTKSSTSKSTARSSKVKAEEHVDEIWKAAEKQAAARRSSKGLDQVKKVARKVLKDESSDSDEGGPSGPERRGGSDNEEEGSESSESEDDEGKPAGGDSSGSEGTLRDVLMAEKSKKKKKKQTTDKASSGTKSSSSGAGASSKKVPEVEKAGKATVYKFSQIIAMPIVIPTDGPGNDVPSIPAPNSKAFVKLQAAGLVSEPVAPATNFSIASDLKAPEVDVYFRTAHPQFFKHVGRSAEWRLLVPSGRDLISLSAEAAKGSDFSRAWSGGKGVGYRVVYIAPAKRDIVEKIGDNRITAYAKDLKRHFAIESSSEEEIPVHKPKTKKRSSRTVADSDDDEEDEGDKPSAAKKPRSEGTAAPRRSSRHRGDRDRTPAADDTAMSSDAEVYNMVDEATTSTRKSRQASATGPRPRTPPTPPPKVLEDRTNLRSRQFWGQDYKIDD